MTAPIAIVCPSLPADVDLGRLLDCIAQVETRRRDHVVGAEGERSRYQITLAVWREHTKLPFSEADNPDVAIQVADAHLMKLRRELLERRIEPTAYRLAICWNAGVNAVMLSKWVNGDVKDYGVRVESLFLNR